MAACMAWQDPVTTAITQMTQWWEEKNGEVTFSRRQMAI